VGAVPEAKQSHDCHGGTLLKQSCEQIDQFGGGAQDVAFLIGPWTVFGDRAKLPLYVVHWCMQPPLIECSNDGLNSSGRVTQG